MNLAISLSFNVFEVEIDWDCTKYSAKQEYLVISEIQSNSPTQTYGFNTSLFCFLSRTNLRLCIVSVFPKCFDDVQDSLKIFVVVIPAIVLNNLNHESFVNISYYI